MFKPTPKNPAQILIIKDEETLNILEKELDRREGFELMPHARNMPYSQLIKSIPDKIGEWNAPLALLTSLHNSSNGTQNMCEAAYSYITSIQNEKPCDILSISAHLDGKYIILRTLIRYYKAVPDMNDFYNQLNEVAVKIENIAPSTGRLIVPEEIKAVQYTDEQKMAHKKEYEKQMEVYKENSPNKPFLNSIDSYVRRELYNPGDQIPMIYDLKGRDSLIQTVVDYDEFISIFNAIMKNYITGTEYNEYVNVLSGDEKEDRFMDGIKAYIMREYVNTGILPNEDVPQLLQRIENALFKLYIVQDLIDDPDISDISITEPDSIRVRIKGKTYISNINFIDVKDYLRFIESICIKNKIDTSIKEQSFTDPHDENYILRFSLTSAAVNASKLPTLHIRKISRKKLLGDDLIQLGMFTPKVRDYLLDCAKYSRGIVIAGPPGSGKTVCLNWLIEEGYEQSVEIIVTQENDELFSYKKGIRFQHPIKASKYNDELTLEDLGELALVAGANVFIIGEAKGGEICTAARLANAGGRTALTLHTNSAKETMSKMIDLALLGTAKNVEQAKRMLKSFETIVYMENFSVREIMRISGYDEDTGKITYDYIYDKALEE